MGLIETMGSPPLIEALAAQLCADCALAGTWEEARSYALQALENRTDYFIPSMKLTLWYETDALVRAGEIERATEDVRRYGERIGTSRRYRISHLRALAVLAENLGEVDTAIEHLQEAAQLAEVIGLPGELWLIQAAQGEMYLKRGEKAQARSAFELAADIVQRLADSISDLGQRANFLAALVIRQLFNHKEQLK